MTTLYMPMSPLLSRIHRDLVGYERPFAPVPLGTHCEEELDADRIQLQCPTTGVTTEWSVLTDTENEMQRMLYTLALVPDELELEVVVFADLIPGCGESVCLQVDLRAYFDDWVENTDFARVGTERAWQRFFHTKILGRGLVWADRLYRENFTEVEEEEAPSPPTN